MDEAAIFAAGCFWGVEAEFRGIPGVKEAESGSPAATRVSPGMLRLDRSAIFTTSDAQRVAAEASRTAAQARFSRPIVTEIVPADTFYRAEDYHQRYFEKQGIRSH